jgi:hypothetical protein
LLKYEDRLPHRKIKDTLKRIYGLNVSPATILDLTRRAADAVQSQYDSILDRIRDASILYVGETSIDVQGKKHWIWVFTTPSETFVAIRKSHGMNVLKEVLTNRFKGIIVCDGWKPYAKFTKHIQRCWAHLLREYNDLGQNIPEAVPVHGALKRIYELLNESLKNNPSPEIRRVIWHMARAVLRQIIGVEYTMRTSESLSARLAMALSIGSRLSFTLGLSRLTTKLKGLFVNMLSRERLLGLCATKRGLRFMNPTFRTFSPESSIFAAIDLGYLYKSVLIK